MKNLILTLLVLCSMPLAASEITPGYTFTDGQRLSASQLGLLVSQASINSSFYTDKAFQGSPAAGDVFLVYSASSATFHQITAQSLLYTNVSIISQQPTEKPPGYAAFLFYDPTNSLLYQTSLTNLAETLSSSVTVSNLTLYTTNGNQLPVYSNFNPASTNNQLMMIVYDTNGVPSSATLTNIFLQYQAFVYTNYTMPYVWKQVFQPWSIYGTNTYGFTNIWGTQNNFAITNLQMLGTNAVTLVDTDTVPVESTQQQTNTSMTLYSLYQYMTNKNALPPYTLARVQFNGNPVTETFTNMSTTTGIITNLSDASSWTTPTPVSLKGWTTTFSTTPVTTSNIVYYAQFTNSSPMTGFQLFTNYAGAVARTNPVLGVTCTALSPGSLFWLTNYTSFNCDAVQISSGTSANSDYYLVQFRAASATPYYYVTSMVQNNGVNAGSAELSSTTYSPFSVTTNSFGLDTFNNNNNKAAFPLVQVLVNPQ